MPNWEYKIITSGALGFASPQMLEQHLNALGREEWEIIHFQTRPDNPLAFQGLARRPVVRDWNVEAAAPAPTVAVSSAVPTPPEERTASVPDADELRAEAQERRETLLSREESLRALDDDEQAGGDEDDEFGDDEDLPTFFEALRPHLRKNQRGDGQAASVEYLAKAFKLSEEDLVEALKECGFAIPAGPKDAPEYLEFDGDLYWLNRNRRQQLWINTREKQRPVFRTVPATRVASGESTDAGTSEPARPEEPPAAGPEAVTPVPLPEGPELIERLRPLMRRNRRDAGHSGSISYLSRALRTTPDNLESAFAALGLKLPAAPEGRPESVEIGGSVYWLNRDKKGQIWINGRPPRPAGEPSAGKEPAVEALPTIPADTAPAGSPLAAVRLLLRETRRGGVAAEAGQVARQLEKPVDDLLAGLVSAGLKVPEKAREKPVFAEHAGDIFWLNRNAKGEIWVNAKPAKFTATEAAEPEATEAPKRRRSRRSHKPAEEPAG